MIVLLPAAVALLACGPAFLAVCDLSAERPFAALAPHASVAVPVAALVAALSAGAQLAGFPPPIFLLLGPPAIGAAPWAAGELLAGPSPRQDLAFAAAVIAAFVAAAAAACAGEHGIAAALSTGVAAAAAYLCTRGRKA